MFWKAGELKDMYDKYKKLEKEISNLMVIWREGEFIHQDEKGEEKKGDIMIKMDGKTNLVDFKITNPELLKEEKQLELESLIVKCFKKTQTKIQEEVQGRTQKIMWFDPSQIGSLWNLLK